MPHAMQASDHATMSAAHELLELCGGSGYPSSSRSTPDAKRAKLSEVGAWSGKGTSLREPDLNYNPNSMQQLAPQHFVPLQPTPAGFGALAPAVEPQPRAMASAQHHPAMQALCPPPSVSYPNMSYGMAQCTPLHYSAAPQPPIQHASPSQHYAPPAPPTFHQANPPAPPTILSVISGATRQHPVGQPTGVPPPAAREAAPAYEHSTRMQPLSRSNILATFLPDLAIPVSF